MGSLNSNTPGCRSPTGGTKDAGGSASGCLRCWCCWVVRGFSCSCEEVQLTRCAWKRFILLLQSGLTHVALIVLSPPHQPTVTHTPGGPCSNFSSTHCLEHLLEHLPRRWTEGGQKLGSWMEVGQCGWSTCSLCTTPVLPEAVPDLRPEERGLRDPAVA